MFLGLIACRRIFGTSVSVLLVRSGGVLVNIVGLVLSGLTLTAVAFVAVDLLAAEEEVVAFFSSWRPTLTSQ